MEEKLYQEIKEIIKGWNAPEDVYAISFFVYSNEAYEFDGYSNLPEFSISYNTEDMCDGSEEDAEERWNYAFWLQNTTPVIEYEGDYKNARELIDWLLETGVTNIGWEDDDCCGENGYYTGKGPAGCYELTMLAANIARRLHSDGMIQDKFGQDLPIIVHDLEYTWYTQNATQKANPDGQAESFFDFLENSGF